MNWTDRLHGDWNLHSLPLTRKQLMPERGELHANRPGLGVKCSQRPRGACFQPEENEGSEPDANQ